MEKVKKFFSEKNTVKSATIILVVTLLISNFLGLIRDHFLAQKIPTNLLDTYYAAFRIPDLVFNILVLGAISAAFIPVFTGFISKKKFQEAWKITSSFLNIAIVVLIVCLVILFFAMPYLIPLLVPKFDPAKQQMTINLAQIFLISPIFFSISYILGGVLNSFKRFLAYSLAPLIYNLSIILATLFLADKYSVYGVAVGVVCGAFLHMIIQLPVVLKLGFKYQFIFDWKDKAVRKIGFLMLPRAIGLGSMQIMLIVYTALASAVSAGSVAIFNLADNIQTMPTVVFATSLATAVFPTLSEKVSLGKIDDFSRYIAKGIRTIIFILIPASIGIILLRAQIVRVILGSGHFGWQQTVDTANTLGFFAISLVAQGLIPLFARSFYALHNTKTPTIISIVSIIFSIILGLIFVKTQGVLGLALAFTIGSFLNAILLYFYLRKKAQQLITQEKNTAIFTLKILFSSAIMAAVIQITKILVEPSIDMTRGWGVLVQLICAIVIGSLVYFLLTWVLKCEEFGELKEIILTRFKLSSSKNKPSDSVSGFNEH